MKKGKKVEDFLIGSGAWPRDYSTTVYLDRHAYWRLAHFQGLWRGRTPASHPCVSFMFGVPAAKTQRNESLSLYPAHRLSPNRIPFR
jgi:hypothetical protein